MLPAFVLSFAFADLWHQYLPWLAAGIVVVLGLLIYGAHDLFRLSLTRIWAISSVCFSEAIRKRTLWITPLAIIGVIVVTQLSHPDDPQEAIRQATKFCLFASGLLVSVVAIILACTNLPKEIDNRVIFTVVTKPTTRLEIVLGKCLGFARISAAIIIIMGIFTYAYLQSRSWTEMASVHRQLASVPPDSPTRPTLVYYADHGFLTTRRLDAPENLQVYGRVPDGNVRWMQGAQSEYFLVPFTLSEEQKDELQQVAETSGASAYLMTTLRIQQHMPNASEQREIKQLGLGNAAVELKAEELGPILPTTQPATQPANALPPAVVSIRLLNQNYRSLNGTLDESAGMRVVLQQPDKPGDSWYGRLTIPAEWLQHMAQVPMFYVQVHAISPATDYGVEAEPEMIFIPTGKQSGIKIGPAMSAQDPGKPAEPELLSSRGARGMILMGKADGKGPLALYRFRNAKVSKPSNGTVPLQLQINIEKNGEVDVEKTGESGYAKVGVEVINKKTGESSGLIEVTPELSQTSFLNVPFKSVEGGDFDVVVRSQTQDQWLGLKDDAVSVVVADESFVVNLFKSLLVLWMLSILVVVIGIFCSTFLSWPIAIICTLVILLGHWGVDQLGSALDPGSGRSIATEFRIYDPVSSRTISQTFDTLSHVLRVVSNFLPDLSKFPVSDYIERGLAVPLSSLLQSLGVLACYGLPLLVLSYVIMRNKEVAP